MFDAKTDGPVTAQSYAADQHASNSSLYESKKQPKSCRDPIFALLFYANLAAIAAVVVKYGSGVFEQNQVDEGDDDDDSNSEVPDMLGFLYAALAASGISAGLSALMLVIMMAIPNILIKVALLFNVVLTGLVVLYSASTGNSAAAIFGGIFFLIFCCYAYMVWSRIPFATANLVTGTTAIRSNCGVTLVGYIMVAAAFAWSALWITAFIGVQDKIMVCETVDGQKTCSDPNYIILFFMLVSYYFTHQVLKNTVHVTVAGVVGTWWFSPDENSFCGGNVFGSLLRALTSSFGSICFGSLIVAILQAIRALINVAKENDEIGSTLACCLDCLIGCLESIMEYFNKWAFVYVGLYGYGFMEAGKSVITLFKDRGWEAVIADDLVGMVLTMLSFVVGLLTGGICLFFEAQTTWFDEFKYDAEGEGIEKQVKIMVFIIGLIVGLVMCSILMGSIDSAVSSVIVLFAEGPAEFEENYPELSRQMRDAYAIAHPGYE